MQKTFISLFLFLISHYVFGQQEDGTCRAQNDTTCTSFKKEKDDDGSLCLPDGACFGSLVEAISHCSRRTTIVEPKLPKPYGKSQRVDFPGKYENVVKTLALTHEYMTNLFQNDTAKSYRDKCQLKNDSCMYWAAIGECEANPNFMALQCAPACQTCESISFEHRCPFDRNAPRAWGPGDLNKMFERLTTETYYVEKYDPKVLSRPPEGPWVITLENLTSKEQCDRMIQLGADRGYERSLAGSQINGDGSRTSTVRETRTSQNTWCQNECYTDETTKTVLGTIENITGIPDANSEFLQLLRYEETQRYRNHHDFIDFHHDRFYGPRLITVFLYLNDVEEGGGTLFNDLGFTVQPKTGRAVIWPSVFDHDPNQKDYRTNHEALPVIKGVKYGANAWVHQRSFKDVYAKNCA